jgi:hypothetical protein
VGDALAVAREGDDALVLLVEGDRGCGHSCLLLWIPKKYKGSNSILVNRLRASCHRKPSLATRGP